MFNKNLFRNCSVELRKEIKLIGEIADDLGLRAYVVGGIVRDIFLNRKNDDLDIVVETEALQLAQECANRFKGVLKSYPKFGTATIILSDGKEIDFAACRAEEYSNPGALPLVRKGSIKEDLMRRDFTINTLAAAINRDSYGQVIDFFGGKKDLDNKVIRVLHKDSFKDDPTRIFRAVRFEQRLGFRIEPKTLKLLNDALQSNDVLKVTSFRYFQEFKKMLSEREPLNYIKRLYSLDGLKVFKIEVEPDFPRLNCVEKRIQEMNRDGFFKEYPEFWLVRLINLLCKSDPGWIEKFSSSAQLTKKQENSILQARRETEILQYLRGNTVPSEVYKTLIALPEATVIFFYCISKFSAVRDKIINFLKKTRFLRLTINGSDLQKIGFEPKFRSELLKILLYNKIDGKLKTKRQEIAYAKKFLGGY